jgi:molybdopterin-containing oxidoreductase family iron-sulfur binding subunit
MVESVWSSTVFTAVAPAVAARDFWLGALGTGVVSAAGTSGIAKPAALNAAIADHRPAAKAEGWSLVLNPSRTMGDGSAGNNPWLQETPDPVTRVTWDPWVAISITDAKALGLGKHGILNIDIGGPEPVQMPAYVQPGQASGSLDVVLGYGRRRAGAVAEVGGVSGIQVNAFTMADGDERIRVLPKAAVSAADGSYKLASTQYHQYMDGRDIALDDQLELHRKDPGFKKRKHLHIQWEGSTGPDGDPTATGHNLSLYNSQIVYPGRRWGMNVDLTTCNGCNACVVACNAENNVPVVGRDEVRIGREMHWMRIDRYYTANSLTKHDEKYGGKDASVVVEAEDPDDVEVIHQPVMCQQCGHAPCEEVCPAMATMHNDEGQNVQVYNRCIGTRYCANNCAYKVRRFNFYEYSKYRFGPQGSGDPFGRIVTNLVSEGSTSSQDEMMVRPLNMVLNPLVTLRSKGVMEKCNFCLQRTREIREEEKRTNTKYDETAKGAITVACAQTCPTGAITFGDINDPDSLVSKERGASPHGYKMLDHYLNTRPSVDYHRRIRNRPPVKDEAYKLADKKTADKKTADKKKTDDHGADAEHGHGDHGEAH